MKFFRIAVLLCLTAIFFISCQDLFRRNTGNSSRNFFWARDIRYTPNRFYKVYADRIFEGEHCIIWAERSSGITEERAAEIATEYDDVVFPKIMDAFSMKNFSFKEEGITYYFDDIMDFTGWLIDQDKKLNILLLDIRDGFTSPEKSSSYVAGYFDPTNVFSNREQEHSNEMNMIYVDTYPGLSMYSKNTYSTLAHEFQHLINFSTSLCNRLDNEYWQMETWIDEGLAAQAEVLYLEENLKDRIDSYIKDKAGTITNEGNNFYVWDNYPDDGAILDDYATTYLFFQWLYLQADTTLKPELFYKIITSPFSDYHAVTNAAKEIKAEWEDWDSLLGTWLAANYINHPSNEYGYKGDPDFKDIKAKTMPAGSSKVELFPGEGVYSDINSSFTPPAGSGVSVRYAGLDNASMSVAALNLKGTLLTFNVNIPKINNLLEEDNDIVTETGYVTGYSAPVKAPASPAESTESFTGPWRIDARDLMGRQRDMELPGEKLLRTR